MITSFSDPTILGVTIFFKVVDACGVIEEGEGRGVARIVLTEFWHLFYQSLSVGASAKVPTIRHDYQRQEWKAVARILLYGYCKEGVYPIALCAAFIGCTILGEDRVSRKVLVESFMAYIAEDEREVVDKCLKNRSQIDNNEDLLEVLGSYNCFRRHSMPISPPRAYPTTQICFQLLGNDIAIIEESPSISRYGKHSSLL
jgi:hypothetical protein